MTTASLFDVSAQHRLAIRVNARKCPSPTVPEWRESSQLEDVRNEPTGTSMSKPLSSSRAGIDRDQAKHLFGIGTWPCHLSCSKVGLIHSDGLQRGQFRLPRSDLS